MNGALILLFSVGLLAFVASEVLHEFGRGTSRRSTRVQVAILGWMGLLFIVTAMAAGLMGAISDA